MLFCEIGFDKTHVRCASCAGPRTRLGEGNRISIDADHVACLADQGGRQQRHVTDTGPDVEHPLPSDEARIAEESLRVGLKRLSLPRQSLMLCVGAAEYVVCYCKRGRPDGAAALCRPPAFSHCGLTLMLQKNPEG